MGFSASRKSCLLAKNLKLQRIVAVKLKQDWSPQQIAGWLHDQYPDDPELWVSHETIYRSLFVQARGAPKQELMSTGSIQVPQLPAGSPVEAGHIIAIFPERY
jgi:IS30 family transposase